MKTRITRHIRTRFAGANPDRPIPYTVTPRCSDLLPIRETMASIVVTACDRPALLPTAGGNDAKWFGAGCKPGEDLIPFAIPRADIVTIADALCKTGAVNLGLRFPHMRQDRPRGGQTTR